MFNSPLQQATCTAVSPVKRKVQNALNSIINTITIIIVIINDKNNNYNYNINNNNNNNYYYYHHPQYYYNSPVARAQKNLPPL